MRNLWTVWKTQDLSVPGLWITRIAALFGRIPLCYNQPHSATRLPRLKAAGQGFEIVHMSRAERGWAREFSTTGEPAGIGLWSAELGFHNPGEVLHRSNRLGKPAERHKGPLPACSTDVRWFKRKASPQVWKALWTTEETPVHSVSMQTVQVEREACGHGFYQRFSHSRYLCSLWMVVWMMAT